MLSGILIYLGDIAVQADTDVYSTLTELSLPGTVLYCKDMKNNIS